MTLTASQDNSSLSLFPLGMQNSALVLEDEDGNYVRELDELSSSSNCSENNIVPSSINVENSSDVIIGPVTQFNGPVTIYQNVAGTPGSLTNGADSSVGNGKLVKSESTSSDTSHGADKPNKKLNSKRVKFIGISLVLLIIVLIVTAVAIILSFRSEKPPPPQDFDKDHVDNDIIPAGSGAIIERNVWGGRPPLNWSLPPLHHPTPLVIISHTVTPFCKDLARCSKRVKSIQEHHVGSGKSPDIGYNFIIGGDGNAYVGRGWDVPNFHSNDSIGICFIGNYLYDTLTPQMINVTKTLLEIGVKNGKLSGNYSLVGHNQTYATQSPGPNVYREIKEWPHFNSSYYNLQ